ncbi:TK/HMTK protein kinase [Salpingoeca rosetta]|uniref:TK/HMTK protein kinase n=1 Tax=Salpingoeca rosetta (strain ATCC 50818 / BSB-021) TaxID=946362 RepID=F2U495_SALR5|nr:TK/HMTK protein kinase [Salpingoeca rosetta]EGD82461.1 TK/HMTK protein kinase [Salpingoeca rosetta]|eukprot:XP_004995697.1 TK/HMTK protein kinase [Salpingoeca rosetta]
MAAQHKPLEIIPKKLRKTLPFEDDDVHTVIKAWYIDSVPVFLDDPDSHSTASERITETMLSALRLRDTPIKVFVVVSNAQLSVIARSTGSIILQIASSKLDEFQVDSRSSPSCFAFSFHSSTLGVDYINVFQVKPKYEALVAPCLEQCKVKQRPHRMSKINPKHQQHSGKHVLGVFQGVLLGSTAVASKHRDDVCRGAADKLKRRQRRAHTRLLPVAIVLTADSIRYAEVLADRDFEHVLLKTISHATVLDDGHTRELFAFIESDDRLDNFTCHLIYVQRGVADRLCQLIGQAKEQQKRLSEMSVDQPDDKPGGAFRTLPDTANSNPSDLANAQIDRDKLTSVSVLGTGQFGRVWFANLTKETNENTNTDDASSSSGSSSDDDFMPCAVKMLRSESTDDHAEEFLNECRMMQGLDHPNVLRLLGVCIEARPYLAVLEMMHYGDLNKVLKTCRRKELILTVLEQLLLIEQAAAGMVYLTSQGIVHMDVAARNMLLHSSNSVKIADFGVAQRVDPSNGKYRLRAPMRLPVRWMAPETLKGKPIYFSERTDIYSFAIFMWEVFTYGQLPFREFKSRDARDKIIAGHIPETPAYMMLMLGQGPGSETNVCRHAQLRPQQTSGTGASRTPRRVTLGATLNASLSQNHRRLSKRASIVRRQSRKGSMGPAPRRTAANSTSLATMAEEPEGDDAVEKPTKSFDDEENWTGTIKRKKSLRQRNSSTASMTSAGPTKAAEEPVKVEGKEHSLVRRDSVEMDLNMFDDGSKFTEFGDSGKL